MPPDSAALGVLPAAQRLPPCSGHPVGRLVLIWARSWNFFFDLGALVHQEGGELLTNQVIATAGGTGPPLSMQDLVL